MRITRVANAITYINLKSVFVCTQKTKIRKTKNINISHIIIFRVINLINLSSTGNMVNNYMHYLIFFFFDKMCEYVNINYFFRNYQQTTICIKCDCDFIGGQMDILLQYVQFFLGDSVYEIMDIYIIVIC